MCKRILFLGFVMFVSVSLQAVVTITPADIQQDAEGYYYLYELTYGDLIRGSTKFEDDASNISNITVHKTPFAIPPATPDPRWVCATTGENNAGFTFVFDFSSVQLDGLDIKIASVELRDKVVMQNNSKFDEDSQIHTSWSVNGTVWNTFNSASTPPKTLLPVTTVETNTLTSTSDQNVFYYRALFENFDSNGFDENLNMWNFLTHSQTDHFYVMIRLDYDILLEGEGTELNPYHISTPEDLMYLGAHPALYDRHFRMINDINMAGYGPFASALIALDADNANGTFDGTPFTGTLDGNHCVIVNLSFTPADDDDYIGLFGYIDTDGQVCNLGIENVSIPFARHYVGGLVAYLRGTITNCYSDGSVNGTYTIGGLVGANYSGILTECFSDAAVNGIVDVGGLAGYNSGDLTSCYATGPVSGDRLVGGLVGQNYGTVLNCNATGSINGSSHAVGGLVGHNYGTVLNCHATGSINGSSHAVGGLVGGNNYDGTLSDCYASGAVSSHQQVGGLAGDNYGTVLNCRATGTVTGDRFVGGLVGHNTGFLTSCYAAGTVKGSAQIGGFVGSTSLNSGITDCYTSSLVIAEGDYYYVGGFIGYNRASVINSYCANKIIKFTTSPYDIFVGGFVGRDDSLITSGTANYTACFWDTQLSGMTDGVGQSDDDTYETPDPTYPDADPPGITGLPTATLKVQGLYTSQGWDFINETTNGTDDIWAMIENVTYPQFPWECINPPKGDVNGDCVVDLLDFVELSANWLNCGLMDQDLCP